MTIAAIYSQFTKGSAGFISAIETHCGFCISSDEIVRISDLASTAEEFEAIWENDDSWTDANNQ